MAHQMSPPPQRPAQPPQMQRPYSPYPNAQSPTNSGIALPAAKRQRLSPNPSSPQTVQYSTPHHEYPAYPPYPPYHSPAPYTPATSPPNFNVPQPHSSSPVQQSQPAPGAMGPPPKPEKEEKEKITDIGDISDVVFGSGIDLREEENYIANTYRNTHGAPSFNSFESGTTIASPNNSFNQLAQANYGSHPAFAGSGPLSQPATSQESIEQEINRKHKAAAQAQAQKQQQHLNDPFLLGDTVRQRLHRLAYEQGVHLNIDGLFDPKPPLVPQGVTATGPDGTGIAAVKAKPIVQENAPFADILALISLAANERLRGLMDEAYTLSRNRRFQDASPERFGATEAGVQASTALPDTLNRLSLEDQQREAERLRRRAQRAANVPATDAIKTENASEAATPDPAASVAPEKPMTKKERERQAKMGQTEEALHKNANTTAAMQLGLGRKGKKYSWMTGGVAAAPINPYKASPKPAAVLTSAPTAGGKAAIGPGTAAEGGKVKERKWGGWNEAGVEGRGVQMRDLVFVLERDGKERKALQRCLLKLDK